MNYLITGSLGFVGKMLTKTLTNNGHTVYGMERSFSDPNLFPEKGFVPVCADINDESSLSEFLQNIKLDGVFHLAAQSSVKTSWDNPSDTYHANVCGTSTLIHYLNSLPHKPKLLLTSTAEVYGNLKNDNLYSEKTPVKPENPYGLSKLFAENICLSFYENTVIARCFPLIGPGQHPSFVLPNFCMQIRQIKDKKKEPILNVGNIKVIRNYTHVTDAANAFILLLNKSMPEEIYNLASDEYFSLEELINLLKELSGVDFSVNVEKNRLRPVDTSFFKVDTSKIKKLGWMPEIPIRETLKEMIKYYIEEKHL
ncbi:MAG: NAD-dependent epimerase/dehydratase [uncultured bacterium]|nr:MAG: NAD-dependent epimerase/dehydratase [uncultured bacterium]